MNGPYALSKAYTQTNDNLKTGEIFNTNDHEYTLCKTQDHGRGAIITPKPSKVSWVMLTPVHAL